MGDDIVLGIDLGTTNSVVAVADAGRAMVLGDLDGQRLIPSVVSFVPTGEVLVGELARERRLIDASNTIYAVKRLIGRPFDSPEVRRARERFAFEMVASDNGGVRVVARGETWALAEISAFVLRECRRIAEQMLGTEVKRAVITVPAAFNELQRSATKAAATVAGLDVVRILNEPTAAAVAYGCGASGRERVVVYDFGGGTFDVTVLDLDDDVFEVVATAGDTFLGGEDIDLLVAERVAAAFERRYGIDPRRDRQAFERLRAAGEWIKCRLSVTEGAVASLPEVMKTEQGEPLGIELEMARHELEEILRPLVARSIEVSAKALEMAKLTQADIDTVVLVGGSTRIPLIAREVERFFEKKPKTSVDPDLVVALGAAVQGYALSEKKPRRTITIIPRMTAEHVAARREKKAEAKRARPAQPAFAQAYLPPLPPRKSVGPPQKTLPFGANELPDVIESLPPEALESIRPSTPAPAREPAPAPDRDLPTQAEHTPRARLDRAAIADALFAGNPDAADAAKGVAHADAHAEADAEADAAVNEDDDVLFLDEPLELDPVSRPAPAADDPFGGLLAIPSAPPSAAPAPALAPPEPTFFDLPEPIPSGPSRPPEATAAPDRAHLAALLGFDDTHLPAPVPSIEMRADNGSPILMDVTPLSLGIETAGGFTERVIRQNSPVPIEQTRMFTTAQDGQETVRVAVCQGESRVFGDNQSLGELELSGIPPARRGVAKISVTFMLDADGLLDVDARDDNGQRRSIQIRLVGGHVDGELAAMRARQERLAPTE